MPLPTVETPTYSFTLPDSKRKINYRPFRVKEEKVLLLASESGDVNTIYQAVHDIVLSCTDGKLDIFKSTSIDSEYALIKLRASSVGETMKPELQCIHCESSCSVNIKTDDLVIDDSMKKDNRIKVNKSIIIDLKFPSFADELRNSTMQDQVDMVFDSVCSSIDKIYSDEEVFDASDYQKEEIEEFVNNLESDTFTQILEFIKSKPRVKIPVKFICPNCKKENEFKIEGVDGFFRLMLCHESLENYYKTNFQLMHHHKYSLAELENMFPFEREIYIQLLVALIKEQEKEQTRGY